MQQRLSVNTNDGVGATPSASPISPTRVQALTPVRVGRPRAPQVGGSNIIVDPPDYQGAPIDMAPMASFIINIASKARKFPKWGVTPQARDLALRDFWPTEPWFASSVFNMTAKYASQSFSVSGPSQLMVDHITEAFNGVQFGEGWEKFWMLMLIDIFTQDNGAIAEIVRMEDDWRSPFVTMNHLDAGRCVRTGRWEEPIIYTDIRNKRHILKWYQVLTFEEMPMPIERMRGMQLCALSRVLMLIETLYSMGVYENEKISGNQTRAVHLVGGVNQNRLNQVLSATRQTIEEEGFERYLQPAIVAALDPKAPVNHVLLELASLPDHFDKDQFMKWLITGLAMAFGVDYQEFAPMPSGNLGTSQQSNVLHLKGRGKGPTLFQNNVKQKFAYAGILPKGYTLEYTDQDLGETLQKEEVTFKRRQSRAIAIQSGEMTDEVATEIAIEEGSIPEKYRDMIKAGREAEREREREAAQRIRGNPGPGNSFGRGPDDSNNPDMPDQGEGTRPNVGTKELIAEKARRVLSMMST